MRLSKRIAAGVLSAMLAVSMLAGRGGTANSGAASSGNNSSSGNNTSAGTSTGNSNTNNSSSSASSEPENVLKTVTWTNSKTNQYFKANGAKSNKYYLDAKYIWGQSDKDWLLKIAVYGNNLYGDMSLPYNSNWNCVFRGETAYIFNNKTKTYKEGTNTEENDIYRELKGIIESGAAIIPTEDKVSPEIIVSKERLYGTVYDCETIRMDNTTYRYCYEGVNLRYVSIESPRDGGSYIVQINKLTATPDSKLFEIPEGYTKAN